MRLRLEHGRRDDLESLHPAYFALVMATGIVAIATDVHGVPVLPKVLFWLNALFLAGLAAATGARIVRYPRAFLADIQSHSRGVGFFTTVAATATFGAQLVLQMQAAGLAEAFWIAAAALWFVTIYGVFAVLTVKAEKPSLAEGLNGAWLVSAVASQAVAMLTVLISAAGVLPGLERPLLFAALVLWLGGGALYLWIVTLILFRYTFTQMAPQDLVPSYWINMGAVAISALAGATLALGATYWLLRKRGDRAAEELRAAEVQVVEPGQRVCTQVVERELRIRPDAVPRGTVPVGSHGYDR